MFDVRHYVDQNGRRPFQRWFDDLDGFAAARIGRSLSRLSNGNTSNVRAVGEGVCELKVDFGPGYRVYFGKDGDSVVILVGGSTKKDQQAAIMAAIRTWTAYKAAKRALRK